MSTSPISRSTELLMLEINCGKGIQGEVIVHYGDTSKQLADEFCKNNKLKPSANKKIAAHIEKCIAQYLVNDPQATVEHERLLQLREAVQGDEGDSEPPVTYSAPKSLKPKKSASSFVPKSPEPTVSGDDGYAPTSGDGLTSTTDPFDPSSSNGFAPSSGSGFAPTSCSSDAFAPTSGSSDAFAPTSGSSDAFALVSGTSDAFSPAFGSKDSCFPSSASSDIFAASSSTSGAFAPTSNKGDTFAVTSSASDLFAPTSSDGFSPSTDAGATSSDPFAPSVGSDDPFDGFMPSSDGGVTASDAPAAALASEAAPVPTADMDSNPFDSFFASSAVTGSKAVPPLPATAPTNTDTDASPHAAHVAHTAYELQDTEQDAEAMYEKMKHQWSASPARSVFNFSDVGTDDLTANSVESGRGGIPMGAHVPSPLPAKELNLSRGSSAAVFGDSGQRLLSSVVDNASATSYDRLYNAAQAKRKHLERMEKHKQLLEAEETKRKRFQMNHVSRMLTAHHYVRPNKDGTMSSTHARLYAQGLKDLEKKKKLALKQPGPTIREDWSCSRCCSFHVLPRGEALPSKLECPVCGHVQGNQMYTKPAINSRDSFLANLSEEERVRRCREIELMRLRRHEAKAREYVDAFKPKIPSASRAILEAAKLKAKGQEQQAPRGKKLHFKDSAVLAKSGRNDKSCQVGNAKIETTANTPKSVAQEVGATPVPASAVAGEALETSPALCRTAPMRSGATPHRQSPTKPMMSIYLHDPRIISSLDSPTAKHKFIHTPNPDEVDPEPVPLGDYYNISAAERLAHNLKPATTLTQKTHAEMMRAKESPVAYAYSSTGDYSQAFATQTAVRQARKQGKSQGEIDEIVNRLAREHVKAKQEQEEEYKKEKDKQLLDPKTGKPYFTPTLSASAPQMRGVQVINEGGARLDIHGSPAYMKKARDLSKYDKIHMDQQQKTLDEISSVKLTTLPRSEQIIRKAEKRTLERAFQLLVQLVEAEEKGKVSDGGGATLSLSAFLGGPASKHKKTPEHLKAEKKQKLMKKIYMAGINEDMLIPELVLIVQSVKKEHAIKPDAAEKLIDFPNFVFLMKSILARLPAGKKHLVIPDSKLNEQDSINELVEQGYNLEEIAGILKTSLNESSCFLVGREKMGLKTGLQNPILNSGLATLGTGEGLGDWEDKEAVKQPARSRSGSAGGKALGSTSLFKPSINEAKDSIMQERAGKTVETLLLDKGKQSKEKMEEARRRIAEKEQEALTFTPRLHQPPKQLQQVASKVMVIARSASPVLPGDKDRNDVDDKHNKEEGKADTVDASASDEGESSPGLLAQPIKNLANRSVLGTMEEAAALINNGTEGSKDGLESENWRTTVATQMNYSPDNERGRNNTKIPKEKPVDNTKATVTAIVPVSVNESFPPPLPVEVEQKILAKKLERELFGFGSNGASSASPSSNSKFLKTMKNEEVKLVQKKCSAVDTSVASDGLLSEVASELRDDVRYRASVLAPEGTPADKAKKVEKD